jgi:three-Cys-motif partner protein
MRKKFVVPIHPDPCAHLVVEKNEKGLGVGRWVPEQKHLLLAKFIGAARGAMARTPKRVFIDPFCGPGRIQVTGESFTRDGGAMVAARQSASCGVEYTQYLIGDLDATKLDACKNRLTAINANVEAFNGPALNTVKLMVEKVPSAALCLAYIDPYNLEYLSFDIFRTLASLRKVDIVVHFSTMDLFRNIDRERDRGRFNDAAPGWQEAIQGNNKSTEWVAFFNYWRSLVQGLGFQFSKEMSIVHNDNHHEIYRLVFFSRHALPEKLWNDVAKNPTADLFD